MNERKVEEASGLIDFDLSGRHFSNLWRWAYCTSHMLTC
jgi:hypothetical protein